MKTQQCLVTALLLAGGAVISGPVRTQAYDITSFDPTAAGPWSDVAKTTLNVPKVANGFIKLDANPSGTEYGGFSPVTVTPGDNAWILDYPEDRIWNDAADSSFTYWLAHDDDYLYIGVDVKDDTINSDDPNAAFWKDDSIEILVDALNDRLDVNTDASNDPYGGHCYVNYEGRFSRWDDDTGTINGQTWSSAVEWTYGPAGEVYAVGTNVPGGWKLEVRFKKTLFEDPAVTNKLDNGYVMGFNIGLDDDDKTGPGTNGDGSRTQDLEIQYFWANRERHLGLTPEMWAELTPEQQKDEAYLNDNFPLTINSGGRLTHGGAGQIVFMGASTPPGHPAELGQTVNGYQDDFTGAVRNPAWKPVGPGGDLYSQADGLLRVSARSGDPNHLLYSPDNTSYSTNVQEVLARMRIVAFGNVDGSRSGLGVGVGTNSQGINLHFRNSTDGSLTGRHFNLLDDARAWGPGFKLDSQTNVWYWLRLKQEKDAEGGTNDVFAKVWIADGATPEPANWQMTWNYIPARTERVGLAGIAGSSIDGVGNFEVDYILIMAEGLPKITVDFAAQGPVPTAPRFTEVAKTSATQVTLQWIGAATLESTANIVEGPWNPIAAAASPYRAPATAERMFYRLKQSP
jgi:hypothetical protein